MATHLVARAETLRDIAKLYYLTADAAGALAHANKLNVESAPPVGRAISLPARLVGYGGISERAEMSTVLDMLMYERRKDVIFVEVQECVYPGSARDVVAIEGKWLYVVSDGAVVARVEANAADDWDADNQIFGGRRTLVDGTIPLLAGRNYSFFLAPYALSAGAESYLIEHVAECSTVAHLEAASRDTTVLVRDAYLWALDLHQKLYLPKLRAWQSWLADKERASRLFIASTLKCLITQKDPGWLWDGTDPLGIRDQLRDGEPDHYLEQVYLKEEREQRGEAERAMALLAEMIDSYDFRALEKSALEEGSASLEMSVMEWACVLPGIIQTHPGRELAARLVADDTRVPLAQIFTMTPSGATLEFAQQRYLLNAVFAIVKDLGPSWVARHRELHGVDALEHLQSYLERLSKERPELRGSLRQMHSNLKQGRPLTHKVKSPQRARQKLIAKSGLAAALEAAEPPATWVKSARLSEAYARNFLTAQMSARGVLEVVNLANALGELKTDTSARKILSALGAAADASALFAEVLGEAAEVVLKEASKAAIKSAAMGLGFISGVCDTIEFGALVGEARAKHDYDAAVGNAIAVAGACTIAVTAALSLSSSWGVPIIAATTSLTIGPRRPRRPHRTTLRRQQLRRVRQGLLPGEGSVAASSPVALGLASSSGSEREAAKRCSDAVDGDLSPRDRGRLWRDHLSGLLPGWRCIRTVHRASGRGSTTLRLR